LIYKKKSIITFRVGFPVGSFADMRIMPTGSGGGILDLDWFLVYRDIKLVIQLSEIEGKDYF
jgi:hypothetical protein